MRHCRRVSAAGDGDGDGDGEEKNAGSGRAVDKRRITGGGRPLECTLV